MILKPGSRLRSQVCTTEVVIVRPPDGDIDLRCGGEPMIGVTETAPGDLSPAPGLDTGTTLGRRYATPDPESLEILVTKAGAGTLSVATTPLTLKDAKPLPSSD